MYDTATRTPGYKLIINVCVVLKCVVLSPVAPTDACKTGEALMQVFIQIMWGRVAAKRAR